MATGTAVLNFTTGGSFDASVSVASTAILATTKVEAYLLVPASDTGRYRDEYWVEDLQVYAGNLSSGVGFTIYGKAKCGALGSFTVNYVTV